MGASQSSPGEREGACAEPCGTEFGATVGSACTFYVDEGSLCCGCDATACALDTIPVGAPPRASVRDLPGPSDPAAAARARQAAARRQEQKGRRQKIRLSWAAIVQAFNFLSNRDPAAAQAFKRAVADNIAAIMIANKKDPPKAQANYAKVFDMMPEVFAQEGLWEATRDESLVPSVLKFAKNQVFIEEYMADQLAPKSPNERRTLVSSWAKIFLEADNGEQWNAFKPVLEDVLETFHMELWQIFTDVRQWLRYKAYNILAASVESRDFWADEGTGAYTTKREYQQWIDSAVAAKKTRAAEKLREMREKFKRTGEWENFE